MSINQNVVGINPAAVFTPGVTMNVNPPFQLGTRLRGDGGREYIFVKAGGAITGAGYVLWVDKTNSAVMLSTSNDAGGEMVGIAPAAMSTGDYGWAQVLGPCSVRVLASCVANARLNTTGTAGAVDDDATAGSFPIPGLVITTTNGGAAAVQPGLINYSFEGPVAL